MTKNSKRFEISHGSKQDKIHRGIPIDEIKKWDDDIRKQKRKEEEIYRELRVVLDEIVQDKKKKLSKISNWNWKS